jgi:hypothetical protein
VRVRPGPALFSLLIVAALTTAVAAPAAAQSSQPDAPGAAALPSAGRTVTVPRVEAEATIDGVLDEPAWQQAARLDRFSQYRPVDSRPAEERTEVLLWYSPSALHVGIVAFDRDPGAIRATVADRDNLAREDTVTIYLDTFLDRRRAFFFGVNALGSQEDGVFSEGQFNPGSMMGGSTDRNPDYLFDSKGRLTPGGYSVEVRVPFKSLRYPSTLSQRWGFNVVRKTQRTGYEDTWTDTRRAASFLAQAGTIEGLHDLERGVVTELQPFVAASAPGERTDEGFDRDDIDPDAGANLRFGFTNVSIDATLNPDFSQVESDIGLVTVNERFALFYPEKRPFFLEGIELFSTPNQLVYTRQIVDPVGGGKVTGKFGRVGVAYLSAVDDTPGDNAWFNVARLRTDFGADSVAGVTLTDRALEGDGNRVLAADARYVFGKMYYLLGQIGGSWTEHDDGTVRAPIWQAEFDRTGRQWGFNYRLTGVGDGFEARAGFVPRNDIIEGRAFNRFTKYGNRGAAVESVSLFVGPTRLWRHGELGSAPIEGNDWINTNAQLRGGWVISGGVRRSFYVLEPERYDGYFTVGAGGALAPYDAPDRLDNLWEGVVGVTTPTWQRVNARAEAEWGGTAIFDEGSKGRQVVASVAVGVRPTNSVRVDLSTTFAELMRERDGSEFARTLLPRARVEYQPRRSLFFRVVGEYRDERVSALYDAVTGAPLVDASGQPIAAGALRGLRVDWLVSYEPSPGTVAYFGYGALYDTPAGSSWSAFDRANDGFFVKVAYLFRR